MFGEAKKREGGGGYEQQQSNCKLQYEEVEWQQATARLAICLLCNANLSRRPTRKTELLQSLKGHAQKF